MVLSSSVYPFMIFSDLKFLDYCKMHLWTSRAITTIRLLITDVEHLPH